MISLWLHLARMIWLLTSGALRYVYLNYLIDVFVVNEIFKGEQIFDTAESYENIYFAIILMITYIL